MGELSLAAESERLRRKLEETSRAVLAFCGVFDLRSLLQAIVEQACHLADAEFGALGLVVAPGVPMEPWVFAGVAPEIAERIGLHPRPVGVLGEVALRGVEVRAPDVRMHPAFRGLPAHHPAVGSLLGVPIPFEGRSVGVLYLGNKRGAAEFTTEDQHVIELLAAHAGAHVAQARLHEQMASERAQLQAIVENAPHGILHVDRDGRIAANPAADDLLGQPLTGLGFDAYRGKIVGTDQSAVVWPPEQPTEARIIRPDGREVPVLIDATWLRGRGGEIEGVVVLLEDVSPFKEIERLREEFAAIVAHDLQNPVSTIQLSIDHLLRETPAALVPVPVESLRRMNRAASRLRDMVSDLLDASRIESQRVKLALEVMPVPTAVATLLDEIRPTLEDHPIELRIEGDPPPVYLDRLRFDQILTNLLENAAKYSGAGSPIVITIAPADGGTLISVQDFGLGIASDEMPRLFDRFYQAKRARAKKSGLGLGLYITKGLVEAHGGRISIASVPGRGSTFRIWLPPARVLAEQEAAHSR